MGKKIQTPQPIIVDNRLVSNFTFATRFKSFVSDIKVNDPASYEELEYMQRVAQQLLEHQAETATDQNEIDYLKRCHPNGIK